MTGKTINIKEFKKKLAYNISIVAIVLGSTFGTFNSAYAADGDDGTGEVVTDATISATDANGLLIDADGDGAIAITIDPDGGITLGAAGDADAITSDSTGAAAVTFTITDSDGAGDLLTIAGDIDIGDTDNDDTMILNSTDSNLYIGNNISVGAATNTVAITAGSGGDVTITVDNDAAEAQSIAATITGSTNTVTLNVTDTGGNAGHTTFTKAISVTNLNINPTDDETAEVTFDAAVTATTITIGDSTDAASDDTTIHFEAQAADYTVAGTIDNAVAADETAIHVLDATAGAAPDTITFSGNIGSTIAVDAITVGSATTGGDAIFSGDVSATAFNVLGGNHADEDNVADMDGDLTAAVTLNDATGTATLKFTGAAAQTMTGAITPAADEEGILSTANTAGKVTFAAVGTDALKLTSVTIAASNEAVFGAAVAANTLTITGDAHLQAADNESEVVAMGASSTLIIDDTLTNGVNVFNEVATTRPTLTSGAKIYLPVNLKTTQTLVLFYGEADNGLADNATTVTETTAAIQDNALFDYTAAASTSNNGSTVVTATVKTAGTTESELGITNNKAVALKQALLAAIDDTNADSTAEDSFANALNGINGLSATADTELANQVGAQTDGIAGSISATRVMTGTVQGIVSSRMASLRSGDAYITGVAAGDGMSKGSGFLQIFGSDVSQKNTTLGSGTEFGYTSETVGYALGFDGITQGGSVIGLSLSISDTDVAGKGPGKSTNDIESYTASIYADKVTDNGYLEGSLTVGINDNATTRKISTAGISRNYKGSYDSEQVSLKIGGGVPSQMGSNGAFITTFGSITGTQIKTDGYTETSNTANDNLRLKIDQDDITSVVGSVGFKIHKVSDKGTPFFSLAINNEFGDDTIINTNTYQGGGSAFKTSTKVEELSATLGLGFSSGSDTTSLNFGYEAEANTHDYLSHYGSLKLVHKF